MTPRFETLLWVAQRASAAVLAFGVAVHLATIAYAVQGGLSAADILGRVHHSVAWGAFYAVFVVAVSVHAPIGLRTLLSEWMGWRARSLDGVALFAGVALLLWGLRAIWAVWA